MGARNEESGSDRRVRLAIIDCTQRLAPHASVHLSELISDGNPVNLQADGNFYTCYHKCQCMCGVVRH